MSPVTAFVPVVCICLLGLLAIASGSTLGATCSSSADCASFSCANSRCSSSFNCADAATNGTCTSCTSPYSLDRGYCYFPGGAANGTACNIDQQCQSKRCRGGPGRCCKSMMANCGGCDQNGECISCASPYTNSEGACGDFPGQSGQTFNSFYLSSLGYQYALAQAAVTLTPVGPWTFTSSQDSCFAACAKTGWNFIAKSSAEFVLQPQQFTAKRDDGLICSCPSVPLYDNTLSSIDYLPLGSSSSFLSVEGSVVAGKVRFTSASSEAEFLMTSCSSSSSTTTTLCKGMLSFKLSSSSSPLSAAVPPPLTNECIDRLNVIAISDRNFALVPGNLTNGRTAPNHCQGLFASTSAATGSNATGTFQHDATSYSFSLSLKTQPIIFTVTTNQGAALVVKYEYGPESCSGPTDFCNGFGMSAFTKAVGGKRLLSAGADTFASSVSQCFRFCVLSGYRLSIAGGVATMEPVLTSPAVPLPSPPSCLCRALSGFSTGEVIKGTGAVVSGESTLSYNVSVPLANGISISFADNRTYLGEALFLSPGCTPSTTIFCGDVASSNGGSDDDDGSGRGGNTGSAIAAEAVPLPALTVTLTPYQATTFRRRLLGARELAVIDPCLAACVADGVNLVVSGSTVTIRALAGTVDIGTGSTCTCPVLSGPLNAASTYLVSGSYVSTSGPTLFFRLQVASAVQLQTSPTSTFGAFGTVDYFVASCASASSTSTAANICKGTVTLAFTSISQGLTAPNAVVACQLQHCFTYGFNLVFGSSQSVFFTPRNINPVNGCSCTPFVGTVSASGSIVGAYGGGAYVLTMTPLSSLAPTVTVTSNGVSILVYAYAFESCVGPSDFCSPYGARAKSIGGKRTATFISHTLSASSTALDRCTKACLSSGFLVSVSGTTARLEPSSLRPTASCLCNTLTGSSSKGAISGSGTAAVSSSSTISFALGPPAADQVAMVVKANGASAGTVAFSSPGCNVDCGSFCGDSGTQVSCLNSPGASSSPPLGAIIGGAVGGVVVVAASIGLAVFLLKKKKKNSKVAPSSVVVKEAPEAASESAKAVDATIVTPSAADSTGALSERRPSPVPDSLLSIAPHRRLSEAVNERRLSQAQQQQQQQQQQERRRSSAASNAERERRTSTAASAATPTATAAESQTQISGRSRRPSPVSAASSSVDVLSGAGTGRSQRPSPASAASSSADVLSSNPSMTTMGRRKGSGVSGAAVAPLDTGARSGNTSRSEDRYY